ncbi:nucleotidyltransferase domain-containing protein [Kribbella qitaiheensis]|uniref:nucleotidyltransferase domain-containing protein n=1 Tax=Kribbella qitaiheensis TaxID=1544730 RepID=UPI003605C578
MFSVRDREQLRDELVAAAKADSRIGGAALTGSGAAGTEDEWSDIDLAFGLVEGADQGEVIADWTTRMYREHGCVHHMDMARRGTIYRVFLLENTLQVDIAFAPAAEFGAYAPTFRLLFGEAVEQEQAQEPAAIDLASMGWLYALHARSSIARGKAWQAEYMISGVRDQVLALACLRYGVTSSQGRGLHLLPAATTDPITATLVRSLDRDELTRAFRAAIAVLLAETAHVDQGLAKRLKGPLHALA